MFPIVSPYPPVSLPSISTRITPKPIKLVMQSTNHDAYATQLLKDMLDGWKRFRQMPVTINTAPVESVNPTISVSV